MAGRRAPKPRPFASARVPRIADAETQRAVRALGDAVQDLQSVRRSDVVVGVDLIVGTNKVHHGLGRACVGVNVTATAAFASFAYGINTANPRPDLEVWIDVVGDSMPNAVVEVF